VRVSLLVIGGGLSGLAAAIRAARFTPDVLLVEKHSRIGGLNSYFYRNKNLFETGLHAVTNFAPPQDKHAPLNKLLRQLKIKRERISLAEQKKSSIVFENCCSISFSNDLEQLKSDIKAYFPKSFEPFLSLLKFVNDFQPFQGKPFISARETVANILQGDSLMTEMLLCPLLYYGSATAEDIDIDQFVIMFRAIFLEGMFRPKTSIKDLLELLENQLISLGGSIRKNCGVTGVAIQGDKAASIALSDGTVVEPDYVISTAGLFETLALLDHPISPTIELADDSARLGFVESIFSADLEPADSPLSDNTIIFYNNGSKFSYKSPEKQTDFNSGVICFPDNFQGLERSKRKVIRTTHLANYALWRETARDPLSYNEQKAAMSDFSIKRVSQIIGAELHNISCHDAFTPLTIEKYTSKKMGAIYGSPQKIKDGNLGFSNLYLAGTDQGFLGIVGSMLSGVSIVNQHVLPRI